MTDTEMQRAIWRGDQDALHAALPCQCCCDEHTDRRCPARRWQGCKGQHTDQIDIHAWAAFYARTRGWTFQEFSGEP